MAQELIMAVLTPAWSLRGTMPAASSSPVDPVFCHLLAAADGLDGDRATVLSVLAAVADPWARRGVRHRLAVILALAVCAVLAGARSFTAIAEWAAADERSALESHSALPVTVIGIDELDLGGQLARLHGHVDKVIFIAWGIRLHASMVLGEESKSRATRCKLQQIR
jgi:DDE_Tnp_1-associated